MSDQYKTTDGRGLVKVGAEARQPNAQRDIISVEYSSIQDAISSLHKQVFGYDGVVASEGQAAESHKPIAIGWKAMCKERESMLKELEERHMRLVAEHEKLQAHCNAQESRLSVYESSSHELLNAKLKRDLLIANEEIDRLNARVKNQVKLLEEADARVAELQSVWGKLRQV
jgi:chromosome segregation ATPase